MDAIRSSLTPILTPKPANAAARAAFFQSAAVNIAPAPAPQQIAAVGPTPAASPFSLFFKRPAAPMPTPAPQPSEPARPLRPGSLIDIRV